MTDPAALAAQFGGVPVAAQTPPPAAAPAGGGDADLARQFGGVPVGSGDLPVYRQSDTSPNEVDPNTFGTLAAHVWKGINPLNLGQLAPLPKSWGGSGLDNPLNPVKILEQAEALRQEGNAAWAKGDKTRAFAKWFDSILPVVGPIASHVSDDAEKGKYMAALGDVIGFLGPLVATGMAPGKGPAFGSRTAPGPATAGAMTAEDAASNAFAAAHDVPLDAATATGSPFLRGVQKVAGESMVGAPAAARGRAAQATALQRVGGELADQVSPAAVTPEQAGAGVTESIRSTMADLHKAANQSYGKLRQIEETAAPDVVDLPPAPVDALKTWQKGQLRRIVHELDASGYTAGKLQTTIEDDLRKGGSGAVYNPRTGGAKVYHDITENLGHEGLDRGEVQQQLEDYLGGGKETAAVQAALKVAKDR